MTRFRIFFFSLSALIISVVAMPQMAQAQFSDSYNFLKAVKERDGTKATQILDQPGSTVVNTRDLSTGETALHYVVSRRDYAWMRFLLLKNANPNIADNSGMTPLMLASFKKDIEAAEILLKYGARIDGTNNSGETPLMRAVQLRDLQMVRFLLKNGADPDITDNIAGKSARDYATGDARAASILEEIQAADKDNSKEDVRIFGPTL